MDQEVVSSPSKTKMPFNLNYKVETVDSIPISLINDLLIAKNEQEYLKHLAQSAEELFPEKMRAIIYKYDPVQKRLMMAAAPSMPTNPATPSWGIDVGPELTPSARAVYFNKAIFCGDITKDPSWLPHMKDAFRLNLKASWAVPIHSSTKEVLGAFSFYFDETMDVPPKIPALIEAYVNIAGLGMEKWKAGKSQEKAISDLKLSEDRLHRALKVRGMGICDYDFISNKMVWDDALLGIFGVDRKDFVEDGSSWGKYVHPEDRARVVRELETAIASNTNLETIYRIVRHGEVRYIRSSASVTFNAGNHPQRLIGLVWDITAKKLAQKKIEEERTKAIASAKMASLGEMASSIAHEINNPLTIILNRASHLREKIENNRIDAVGAASELTKVEDTVGRIAKIIRGLSAFSRNSESDPMIECDLHSIVADSFELCRERFAKEGIEIRLFGISEDLVISCRPSQISQVFINLINNSFDALQSLKEKWLGVHVKQIGKMVEISVIDSGPGIPDVVAEKIMEPFFTTKEIGRGTGLGLSISKGIIEDHNGKLLYDRNYANTRFVIVLPLVN